MSEAKLQHLELGPAGWSRPCNMIYSHGPSVWELLILRSAIVCQVLSSWASEIGCFDGTWIVLRNHPRNSNLHVTFHIATYCHFSSCHIILPHLRLAGAGRLIFRVAEGKGCGSPLAKIMGLYSSGTLLNGTSQHFRYLSQVRIIRKEWPTQQFWQGWTQWSIRTKIPIDWQCYNPGQSWTERPQGRPFWCLLMVVGVHPFVRFVLVYVSGSSHVTPVAPIVSVSSWLVSWITATNH